MNHREGWDAIQKETGISAQEGCASHHENTAEHLLSSSEETE